MKTSRDLDHAHQGNSLSSRDNTSGANPCKKFDDSIFSLSKEI